MMHVLLRVLVAHPFLCVSAYQHSHWQRHMLFCMLWSLTCCALPPPTRVLFPIYTYANTYVCVRRFVFSWFGEGITVWGDEIIMLTWKSGYGMVFDLNTLEEKRTFTYVRVSTWIVRVSTWISGKPILTENVHEAIDGCFVCPLEGLPRCV